MEYLILGPLQVRTDGRPVDLGPRRRREVLALLLLHAGELLPLERIVDELWPEGPPATATKVIQNAISGLRRSLGEEVSGALETRDGGYVLHVRPGELDVERFEERLAAGRGALDAGEPATAAVALREALDLWRGGPLEDLALEPFAQREVSRLHERRVLAEEARIEAALALGRASDLIGDLEALTAEHPLRENLRGQLMLALYRSGRQADALEVYRRARAELVDALGIEPGRELRRLQQAILEQDPSLDLAPAQIAAPPSAPAGAAPLPRALAEAHGRTLYAREAALALLREDALAAAAGTRRVVLVAGDAGIGKTRLAAELGAELHEAGWGVLYGRSDEDGLIPFQPLAEAIRHGAPLEEGAADAAPDRQRLFEAVTAALRRAAAARPLLLVVDDLHWADQPTLLLLRHLMRDLAAAPLLVLGTHRDVGPATAPELADLLADLRREPFTRRLQLDGLPEIGIAALVAARLAADATPELVRRIQEVTGGNPFLADQLAGELAAAHAEDPSRPPETLLRRLAVPEGVREVVGRRVRRLGDEVGDVLVAAAVSGQEFRLEIVEAVVDDPDQALSAVERALDARLVVEGPVVDRFAFAHALVRETLYSQPSASRRVRLHRMVGEALEFAGGARAAELAHHFHAASAVGGAEKAAAYGILAARDAMYAHAYEEAAEHCRRVLEDLGDDAGSARCEARLELAAALEQAGEVGESRAAFAEAARDARALRDPALLSAAALGFAKWQLYGLVDHEAVELLEDALAALPTDDDPVRASVLGLLAARIDPEAEPARRERLLAEAVAMARRLGDPETLAGVLRWMPYVASAPERIGERLAASAESVRLADAAGSPERGLWGHVNRFADVLELGEIAEADAELEASVRLAHELRHGWFAWYAPMLQGTRALFSGRLAEGERLVEAARRERLRFDSGVNETHAAQRLMATLLRGTPEEADGDVLATLAARHPDRRVWAAMAVAVDAHAGRLEPARAGLEALAGAPALPRLDGLSVGVMLAEACAVLEDAEAAAWLRPLLAPFATRQPVLDRGWACWGSLGRHLGRLASVLEDWEAGEEAFALALERSRATGAAGWAAHAAADHAAMLVRRGRASDRKRAQALVELARGACREEAMPGLARRLAALDERLAQSVPASPSPPSSPGRGEPGTHPPGTQPPGTQPPGTQPAGAAPPGTQPAGAAPPGTQPAGAAPPGTQPAGAAPPGTQPAGAAPPGTQPAGATPPGTGP
jgi:DNA-binding SARP family transcriptional activator